MIDFEERMTIQAIYYLMKRDFFSRHDFKNSVENFLNQQSMYIYIYKYIFIYIIKIKLNIYLIFSYCILPIISHFYKF